MKIYPLDNDHYKGITETKHIPFREINKCLKNELHEVKCSIDGLNHKEWELAKKKMNEYEYIYTSSKVERNICSIIPVSRSYFKLHEIIKDLLLLNNNYKCSCLAEGPGGFIHCLNDKDVKLVYGITLISRNNKKIPYWNQLIINNKKNKLCYGTDKTGNIYRITNVDFFINMVGSNKCEIVTADGGFDYSKDYNSQEDMSYKLLYCEIFIALNIQEKEGSFIIKFFDLFNYDTIKLLYILYINYKEIIIHKPLTSRLSNSEKYIVCRGFLGKDKNIINLMRYNYSNPSNLIIDIPESFVNNIKEYNNIYINKQKECITSITDYIKNNDIDDKPTSSQIISAKKWCEVYNAPINLNCNYLQ